jgi:multidrug efflux pump subunit AcrB
METSKIEKSKRGRKMKTLTSWLERKKAALCILAGIFSISLFVIINSGEKIKENQGGSYVVKIRHYGIDAGEMERSITIPLEDVLFAIPGVMSVQSSSENSLTSVFIRFKSEGRGRYEAVRDAAQRVYETLPSSVQRPEILSSNNSRIPVWSAAVAFNTSINEKENVLTTQTLEKIIKPKLESLEGAGEVLVSGVGNKQIFIILDQEKLASVGLQPQAVAAVLGMNDSIFSGGLIIQQNREIIVTVDGRYSHENLKEKFPLYNALIPLGDGKYTMLSEIAEIIEQEREPDIFSRLNGRKTAGIAIMGKSGADLRKLSLEIKKELAALDLPIEFTVLSDLGAEEAAAFRSVFNAALSGAIMVALICFLLDKSNLLSGVFCAVTIPFICLITSAILSMIGFTTDRLMLAGIAAGVGTAVDSVILCSERFRKHIDYHTASLSLPGLTGLLTAGAATTIAALLPLLTIDDGGAKVIASAIIVITITSLIISLSILPPLLLWNINSRKTSYHYKLPHFISLRFTSKFTRLKRRLSHFFCRLLAVNVRFCVSYPIIVLAIGLALIVFAILALYSRGVDTSGYGSEDSVYAQVEFDGGLLAEETDRLLAAYGEQLAANVFIKNVETGARTGSGSLLISFDPKQTKAHLVRELAKHIPIPGGFIFFLENSSKDRYWEIKFYGDDDTQCRKLAEEFSYISTGHPLIREHLFNFKQGSKKLILQPDRELFSEAGIFFSNAATNIRTGVYGPVAYKRMDLEGETDVRILTGGSGLIDFETGSVKRQSREGTLGLLVSPGRESNASLQIDSLMRKKEETEPSSIRRDNRRRTASITITTKPMDPRRVKKELLLLIEKLDLPPGYSVEFDPEAIRQAQNLSATLFLLFMSVIFCYMIIACINESFTVPLIVLAAIPPSLSVPAIILTLSGNAYNLPVACAFIAVSGMTVNAVILCIDNIRLKIRCKREQTSLNIYLALRQKIPALLATTCTTVAGAIPFLFLNEEANILIRTIALVGALGVTCSFICSVTVIPSIFIISKESFRFFSLKNSACAG